MNKKELELFIENVNHMTRFNLGLEKEKHLVINGRRWFEKVNGNTYHSVNVWINGQHIGGVGFEYGYGDQYIAFHRPPRERLREHMLISHVVGDRGDQRKVRKHPGMQMGILDEIGREMAGHGRTRFVADQINGTPCRRF